MLEKIKRQDFQFWLVRLGKIDAKELETPMALSLAEKMISPQSKFVQTAVEKHDISEAEFKLIFGG